MKKNIENKEPAVILRALCPSRSRKIRVDLTVNDGAETNPRQALKRSLRPLACGSSLKMTRTSQLNQKRSSRDPRLIVSQFPRMAMLRILHFAFAPFKMTIPTLAFVVVLSVGMLSESMAELISCVNGKYADGTECEKCGDNCNWSFDTTSGKLSVSGSGKMYGYSNYNDEETNQSLTTAPWKIYKNEIKSIKVEGLSTIGAYAFCHSGNQLSAVEMDNTVTNIGSGAFAWNSALSNIKLSDSLKEIGYIAFRGSSAVLSPAIIVPDTLEKIGTGALGTDKNTIQNIQIICLGDEQSCERVKDLFNEYIHYGGDYSNETLALGRNLVVANYLQCDGGNYFWDGAKCVREPNLSKHKCCASCKDMGGYCNRIRYTPAEAAEVLKDDDNEIIMTFKVNR